MTLQPLKSSMKNVYNTSKKKYAIVLLNGLDGSEDEGRRVATTSLLEEAASFCAIYSLTISA